MMFDERFRDEGVLVFEQMFAPELIDSVRGTIERQSGPIDPERPPQHMPVDELRLHMPVRLEGSLLSPDFLFHPLIGGLLKALLGNDYLIDSLSVVTALPGAPTMHLHRDHSPLFPRGELDAPLPPYAITLVVPLIATDDESGTTMVARSSMAAQKVADDELSTAPEWIVPHLPLGGCFLMDYRTWHRGMANRSARERPILYVVYAREWFCDDVNFHHHARMIVDHAAFAELAPEQRYRLRRAAAAGLVDATVAELGATAP